MKKTTYLSSTDVDILIFLWRWKIATSAILAHRFFPDRAASTVYKHLKRLECGQYIELKVDERGKYWVWSLRPSGFKAIREELPPLKEEGYKSEFIRHDLLVNLIHLGSFLCRKETSKLQFFTEQQLRRYELEEYPSWVPNTEVHRPDGYWHIEESHRSTTIALEVELTVQKRSKYSSIGNFYKTQTQVDSVVWVVKKESEMARISNLLGSSQSDSTCSHKFVLLSHFLNHGWRAPIVSGSNEDRSLSSLLIPPLSDHGAPLNEPLIKHGCELVGTDMRKRRFKTITCSHGESL